MKHVGVRSNAKDIVSQEQLSALGDFKKDGSVQMTGGFNEAAPVVITNAQLNALAGRIDWSTIPSNTGLPQDSQSFGISGMTGAPIGAIRRLRLAAGTILSHSDGTFELPTQANITARFGDTAEFQCRSDTRWVCLFYNRFDGTPLVGAAGPASTDGLSEGTTNLYFTAARVLSVTLAGLSLVTGSAVVATDSILVGIGKLQRQINDLTTTVAGKEASITGGTSAQYWNGLKVFTDFATSVRSAALAGLSLASPAAVTASDTVLAAIGKLQAQITNNAFRVETIATTSVGQTSYAVPNGYTAGAVIVFFNGALLAPADYAATDGANVVLASGSLTTSDIMSVIVIAAIRAQDDALLQYTVAALPAASANLAKQRWCTNMAGGAGVVVSNGTNWLRVADNTIVTV